MFDDVECEDDVDGVADRPKIPLHPMPFRGADAAGDLRQLDTDRRGTPASAEVEQFAGIAADIDDVHPRMQERIESPDDSGRLLPFEGSRRPMGVATAGRIQM